MASRYWVNDTLDGLWSTAGNWAAASGGAGGAGVPGLADQVILDGVGANANADMTMDFGAGTFVGSLSITSAYTGTVFAAAGSGLKVNTTLNLNGGTFYLPDTFVVVGLSTIGGDATVYARGDEIVAWCDAVVWTGNSTLVCYDDTVVIDLWNYGQRIPGPPDEIRFVNLVLGNNKTHQFAGFGDFTSISGTLSSNALPGTPAIMESDGGPGDPWGLLLSGSSALSDTVTVTDSNAALGPTVRAFGSLDSGGNNNWTFSVPPGLKNPQIMPGCGQMLGMVGASDRLAIEDGGLQVRT